jgi:hypothetical protein
VPDVTARSRPVARLSATIRPKCFSRLLYGQYPDKSPLKQIAAPEVYDSHHRQKEASLPNRQRSSVSSELQVIARSLGSISEALARLVPLVESSNGASAAVAPAARTPRKLNLSPQRRAALKLQGQYMGYLRGLKPRQKARVKALAASKGVRAGVSLARELARG